MHKVIPEGAVLIPDKAEKVFGGMIYDVYQWEQANFDDSVTTFEMLKRPDTVEVLAVVDDKLLILEDEQPHRGMVMTFPGGRVDTADESTLAAAKREMLEETGCEFSGWRLVRVVQPQHKLEWFVHTFVAWNVSGKTDHAHEPGEKINVLEKTYRQTLKLMDEDDRYLSRYRDLLEEAGSLKKLSDLPEFNGKEVDR